MRETAGGTVLYGYESIFARCFLLLCLVFFLTSPAYGETVSYHQKASSGLKYLTVCINNIPFEMVFDTGSSHIVVNAEAMRKLGLSQFNRKLEGDSVNGTVESYSFHAESVRVGSLVLKNVEVHYVPDARINLLGGTFLAHFNYFVSERDKSITFFPYNAGYISEKDSYLYLHIKEKK